MSHQRGVAGDDTLKQCQLLRRHIRKGRTRRTQHLQAITIDQRLQLLCTSQHHQDISTFKAVV